jgi:hypothetical protein
MRRHRRWSHGKCSHCRRRPPPHRLHPAIRSADRSADHHRWRRHCWRRRHSGRPCSASERRRSAGRPEVSRLRRRSGRFDRRHSGHRRRARRSDRPPGRRIDRRPARRHRCCHRRPGRRLASHRPANHHLASRRSSRPRRSACSNRSDRPANRRCCPTKTASRRRPGSASKRRRRRCCHRLKACSVSCVHRLSCRRTSRCYPMSHRSVATMRAMKAWMRRTIAAAGSRPSEIRRPLRLRSPVRRSRAETCASAECASFLLVPPPHRCGYRRS